MWGGFHRLHSMILAFTSEVTLATRSLCASPTSKGVREVNQAFDNGLLNRVKAMGSRAECVSRDGEVSS